MHVIRSRYVQLAIAPASLSDMSTVTIEETLYRRGREYLRLAVDMQAGRVVFVTPGRDAKTIESLEVYLGHHHSTPEQGSSVSIDMAPAFINAVGGDLPDAKLTFDMFHVVARTSTALDTVSRRQQKADPELKGMRCTLLEDANKLNLKQLIGFEALVRQYATKLITRGWL
ncbi:transposase [Paraburkholderia sp. BL8N3]|nr:transposase [Paraburkholderia sp. BL8N3]